MPSLGSRVSTSAADYEESCCPSIQNTAKWPSGLVATAKNDFQMHYLVNCFSLFFLTVLEGLIPLLLIWKSGEKSINIAILDREDTIIK